MTWRVFCRCVILAALTAAVAVAQGPARGVVRQRMGPDEAALLGIRDLRIAADLNLTADQQTKIRDAFQEAAEFRRGVVEQTRGLRNQLVTAVKANDKAMIDQISGALGKILEEQVAFQANTVAKVYGLLTPEQKIKLDEEVSRSLGYGERARARGL